MKMLDMVLNCIIGAFIGTFIGNGIYRLWDFKAHPDLYAAGPAPWYTGILLHGAVTVIVAAIAVIIKLIIRNKVRES